MIQKGMRVICTEELSLTTGVLLTKGKAYNVNDIVHGRLSVIDDNGNECHANPTRFREITMADNIDDEEEDDDRIYEEYDDSGYY